MDDQTTPSVDSLIDDTLNTLDTLDPVSDEFRTGLDNLKILQSMKPKSFLEKVDPNVILSAASSLGGIVMIMKFERLNVIATKAFSLIPKIRVF